MARIKQTTASGANGDDRRRLRVWNRPPHTTRCRVRRARFSTRSRPVSCTFNHEGASFTPMRAAQALLGAGGREIVGRSLRDFEPNTIRPDGSPFPSDEYPATRCLRTGQPQCEPTVGVRLATGQLVWLMITATPVNVTSNGAGRSVIVTFVDVTHSREIEISLRQSEDRYRRLVEDVPDAILVHSNGIIAFVNDAGVKLWGGKSREEFIGRHVMEFVHPRYHEIVAQRIQGHVGQDGAAVQPPEYPARRPAGAR